MRDSNRAKGFRVIGFFLAMLGCGTIVDLGWFCMGAALALVGILMLGAGAIGIGSPDEVNRRNHDRER